MDKLNYFSGGNENDLTRAYLTLLKHSCISFITFIEYCKSKHHIVEPEKLLSLFEIIDQGYEIRTQVGTFEITTNYLLSVLITDKTFELENSKIQTSERKAIYDGVVSCGNALTIILENKPRSTNVWFDQLNPSIKNLLPDLVIYSKPCLLEWKEIVNHLSGQFHSQHWPEMKKC